MKAIGMNFDGDAFISYAHLDNVELIEGHKGWVANLHRALEIRVGQLLGKEPQIWRDPKLQGNDFFAETLVERLRKVASLIAIISPRYVRSEWARREITEFWKAAEQQGGLRLGEQGRVFKVLKTPVPRELQPQELQALLGYEFFKVDPETGKVRELDEIFGAQAQRDFWIKLDDLAHDICGLLHLLETEAAETADAETQTIFLAETTSDLREQREAIKRDLQQHGHVVLPSQALPLVAPELKDSLRADLAKCQLSIHLVGKNYSLVPEGSTTSLVEVQNEMAIARAGDGGFGRVIWIPASLQVADERQRKVLDSLRNDPRLQLNADLLETSIEDLKTVYHDRLTGGDRRQVYVIYDQRDVDLTPVWTDFLFKHGVEILRSVFEGDEAEIREYHQENLANCDAALIIYGKTGELWLRRKLREIQKSAGYGRTKPMGTVGIWLAPPRTPEKETFRTHEAMVIPQMDAVAADSLMGFISRLGAS
jgi:TIR domain